MLTHRYLRIVVLLLALLALPALTMALAPAADVAPGFPYPEQEPNNSFDTSNSLGPGWEAEGRIAPARDKDFYNLYVYAGINLVIDFVLPPGSKLVPVVTVYREDQTVLTSATCRAGNPCVDFLITEEALTYIRVTDHKNRGGKAYGYSMAVNYGDPNEPNDTIEQATPYVPDEVQRGLISPAGDVDFYAFAAEAGDEFQIYGSYLDFWLYGPNGEDLGYWPGYFEPIFRTPETGVYYLKVFAQYNEEAYEFRLRPMERPLLVSFDSAGTIGGVAFEAGDALRYTPSTGGWELFFDGSALGLTGNLVAMNYTDGLSVVYDKVQSLPLGAVKRHDALRFVGYLPGGEPYGYLEWYLDGSTVGLTTAGEAIDALASGSSSDDKVISTRGAANVPGFGGKLRAQKDDALLLTTDYNDPNFRKVFALALDGKPLGVAGANLIAMDDRGYRPEGWFLAYDRPVTLDGVTYDRNDIIYCWATDTAGCEQFETAFDAALFGGYNIDAIDVFVHQYVNN